MKFSQSRKKTNFCKGVSPWFLSKNWPFSHMFFFLAKKSHKETFFDILDTKKSSLVLKSEVLTKSKKNRHFAKGLVHGFCHKIDLFIICFLLSQKRHKERFFDILDRKVYFLDLKTEVLKKWKKSTFCKGVSPWYFSKNRPFPYLFFWAKKARKKHFLIFWIEKNAF